MHPFATGVECESLTKRKDLLDWEAKIEGGYYRVPRWRLTARCHGYSIIDTSDECQDASLRADMGNVGLEEIYLRRKTWHIQT